MLLTLKPFYPRGGTDVLSGHTSVQINLALCTYSQLLPLDALPSVDFVKWSSQGMLRMSPDAMNALFKPTIDSIIEHLRECRLGLSPCGTELGLGQYLHSPVGGESGSGSYKAEACSGVDKA